eukprot:GHVU01029964.1.p1 GENE.GHVU01029964.1~~GHVU01029964.1.p1  ORF type:complete len:325 (-),score=65.32 GHVU01029964.1:2607-3581(-)
MPLKKKESDNAGGSQHDREARDLIKQAEKKCQGGGFFAMLGGSGPNYDEACHLYQQASNKYKLSNDWQQATECILRCVELQKKMKETSRQATLMMEAGNLAKKYSSDESVRLHTKAIELLNECGRFSQSAKTMKGIAEIQLSEGKHLDAMQSFKKAADYFNMDDFGKSQHTQCILKYAELAAQHDRKYDEAIKIFEAEAEKAVASNLIQFNAKEYLLKAGILRLCVGDTVDINLSLENYSDLDPRFSSSREGKLFANLCSAFEANDLEKFVGSIREYDSISRLDAWKVAMLSIVKTGLSSADPGEASHGPAAAVLNSAGEVDLT